VKNVRGVKKVKNISEDAFGTKLGRIHVPAQEISKIQVHLYTASGRVDTENLSENDFSITTFIPVYVRVCSVIICVRQCRITPHHVWIRFILSERN